MKLPAAIAEVPVLNLASALAHYREQLGFSVDWSDEGLGLAGLSRDEARLFLANAEYRAHRSNAGPVVLWLNLSGRSEVDALYEQWSAAGVGIAGPPQAQPHKLYEFFARDLDGNVFRVFYDFAWEGRQGGDRP